MLKPFMISTRDHAKKDMAGPYVVAWQSISVVKGFEVLSVLEGLGSKDDFTAIFVEHIADAASERGISLH